MQAISLSLAILLSASLFFTPAGTAQRPGTARRPATTPSQRPAVATAGRTTALTATTANVLKDISRIRELSIRRQVRSSTQSRAEIQRMLIKSLNEESTPAEMHATEMFWKKLGLAPADFRFRDFLIELLTEQVAGYYEPKSKQFHVADWIDLDAQKPVMAHELTHALQDQHFNLRRFEHWPKGDSDAELAAHALVEGDASLAMELYIVQDPLRVVALLKAMNAGGMGVTVQLDRAPKALRGALMFPYFEGSLWAKELYKRGGWTAVSRAFTELPKSSEQILHAEKYFAKELPVKVNLPDISGLLNASGKSAVNSGDDLWRRVDYDVTGELGFNLILDEFLKSSDESKRAAAGWGGDRFAAYEGPRPGDVFIVQLSVWDTEKDAREFFDAYAKRTERRYPNGQKSDWPDSDNATSKSKLQTGLGYRWLTSEGSVVMTLRGSRVIVLEGLPASMDPQSVLRTLENN